MSYHYLIALCGKEDWLQHLCSTGEHDGSYLHFHKYTSYHCFFLIREARSGFIYVDTGSLFDKTMHQLPAEHDRFKINLSDRAQLPRMNVTCFSRGARVEPQVTVHWTWQGFVPLAGSWLPLAAIWQLRQLFAAQRYYVACRKGMWWYCSLDLQLV